MKYKCGKCGSESLYLDIDYETKLQYISCLICGNRYPGGLIPITTDKIVQIQPVGKHIRKQRFTTVIDKTLVLTEECTALIKTRGEYKPRTKTASKNVTQQDRFSKYRAKMRSEGKCPHCGKPCAPYAYCEERRRYFRERQRNKVKK